MQYIQRIISRSFFLFLLFFMAAGNQSKAQISLKNNLLYDATLTPNLGVEMRTGSHWTMGVNAGYHPWPTDDMKEKKLRHLMIAPNVRWWPDSTYHKGFWGATVVYSHYNVSNLKFPFGLYPSIKGRRKQGDLIAIGLSYGRSWRLSNWWRLEAEAGVDVGYTNYKEYDCVHCGPYYGKEGKVFLMPKLGLNIALGPKRKNVEEPDEVPAPVIVPPTLPELIFGLIKPATAGDILMIDNPVLAEYKDYKPYDKTRILRKEKGALYVHFPLDKTELIYDYRDNAPVLDRIIDITRQIMEDTKSNVRLIQIIGLASAEGPEKHNVELGQNRAIALKNYIQERVATPDSLYELNNGGEAWAELRDAIVDERMGTGMSAEEIDQALAIIDGEANADRREQRLKRLNGGRTYKYILENLLPDQRNSGYLRVYFDRVPDTKAEAINRAVQLMQQQRWDEALPILNNVREDPRSWNALGVALFQTGQREQSLDYFRRAASNGNADAQRNADQLERYLDALRTYQAEYEKYNHLIQSQSSKR